MKVDINKIADDLASDRRVTDYDFWWAVKIVDDELYRLERNDRPVPFRLIQARWILRRARERHVGSGRSVKS